MTTEIELSVMDGANPGGVLADRLRSFEEAHDIKVNLTILAWETSWTDIVKYALYGRGPDVSEIGSTWLASLVGMNALRPFCGSDIVPLESQAFLPQLWESGLYGGELYGVPWFADTRLLYYRRDILQKSGINPAQAFSSAHELEKTIQKLKDDGVDTPWIVPTDRTLNNLHILAAWVWGAGGDFLSPDGKEILIDRPESLKGFCNYFRLRHFISARSMLLGDDSANRRFRHGKAAMLVSGPWVRLTEAESHKIVLENYGAAPLPGVPFVGSSHIVVWKHSQHGDLACKLVEFLTSEEFQRKFYHVPSLFPSRTSLLDEGLRDDPVWHASVESIRRGRTFPVASLWGLLEDRLSIEIGKIWSDIAMNPNAEDTDSLVCARITALAERLRSPSGF
ncbi:MAG: extracellular solute-binding protein [Anaerolineales bacterium]